MWFLTCNAFCHSHTFVTGFVSQHRTTNHVTDCPYIWQVGTAISVNGNETTFVFSQANRFSIQTISVRDTADGHNQFIIGVRFGFAANFVIHSYRVTVIADFIDFHAQQDAHALVFGQDFERFACNLLIGIGQEFWHRFQYGHVCTQTVPHRTHFQTNHTRTNQAQFGGYFGQVQSTFVVQNGLVVHISTRQWARHRTSGNDDVFGFNHRFFTLVVYFDLPYIAILTF